VSKKKREIFDKKKLSRTAKIQVKIFEFGLHPILYKELEYPRSVYIASKRRKHQNLL